LFLVFKKFGFFVLLGGEGGEGKREEGGRGGGGGGGGEIGLSLEKCWIDAWLNKKHKMVSINSWLIEGTGYEARQTSEEQTKMPRFMFEGPRPCTIFCFALIHYA